MKHQNMSSLKDCFMLTVTSRFNGLMIQSPGDYARAFFCFPNAGKEYSYYRSESKKRFQCIQFDSIFVNNVSN